MDSLLAQAKNLVGSGRTSEARRLLQRLLKQDPQNAPAWTLLAKISSPQAKAKYLERAAQLEAAQPGLQGDAAVLASPLVAAAPRVSAAPLSVGVIIFVALFTLLIGSLVWWGSDYLSTPPTPAPRKVLQGGVLPKATLTYTPTFTPTHTPTITPTFTPTFTATFTPSNTPTITPTFTPSLTFTPRPTNTSRPPTNTPLPRPTDPPPAFGGGGERWIDVNLSKQKVVAYEGVKPMATFIVSTGTWQYPTAVGKFSVYVKYISQTMWGDGYYLPNVPYVMYFYEGYGLHGTYWHNNFGVPMSHGCVNLRTPDAAWLFNFASIGTLVNVHY